ncbi:MAG TPA: hypothetical protein VHV77_14415, partial [Pirellulales bacterium]|nr:hypothetical protein [Pirellulales bacterium]
MPGAAEFQHGGGARLRITDKGVTYIATHSKLRILGLSNAVVTDSGLRQLASLRDLTDLSVDSCSVTGEFLSL